MARKIFLGKFLWALLTLENELDSGSWEFVNGNEGHDNYDCSEVADEIFCWDSNHSKISNKI